MFQWLVKYYDKHGATKSNLYFASSKSVVLDDYINNRHLDVISVTLNA